jgi:hypothetical protein
MGLKILDVAPVASYGPTAVTPYAKDVVLKAFRVSRTDTTASVKCVLPADATIVDVVIYGAASDAGTTATISVGTTSTANELVNAQDVKTAGGLIRPTSTVGAAFAALENTPLGTDISLYAKYAESGTASSAGGPYTVIVSYVR